MKSLLATAAAAAVLALAGPVSAQMYPPMNPPPPMYQPQTQPPMDLQQPTGMQQPMGMQQPTDMPQQTGMQQPMGMQQPASMQQPTTISGSPTWMQDDGSSSDHPIHNPGDVSGDQLNARYQGGLTTAPGTGFPAGWNQR